MLDFFRHANTRAKTDGRVYLTTFTGLEDDGTGRRAWIGAHPKYAQACVYWVRVSPRGRFPQIYADATHEIKIGLTIRESDRVRLLYQRQADFRLPELDADDVCDQVVCKMINFLLNPSLNPKRCPGMYYHLSEGQQQLCLWEKLLNNYRNELLRVQLRKLGMSSSPHLF
jgi:hypothetical protein